MSARTVSSRKMSVADLFSHRRLHWKLAAQLNLTETEEEHADSPSPPSSQSLSFEETDSDLPPALDQLENGNTGALSSDDPSVHDVVSTRTSLTSTQLISPSSSSSASSLSDALVKVVSPPCDPVWLLSV